MSPPVDINGIIPTQRWLEIVDWLIANWNKVILVSNDNPTLALSRSPLTLEYFENVVETRIYAGTDGVLVDIMVTFVDDTIATIFKLKFDH